MFDFLLLAGVGEAVDGEPVRHELLGFGEVKSFIFHGHRDAELRKLFIDLLLQFINLPSEFVDLVEVLSVSMKRHYHENLVLAQREISFKHLNSEGADQMGVPRSKDGLHEVSLLLEQLLLIPNFSIKSAC